MRFTGDCKTSKNCEAAKTEPRAEAAIGKYTQELRELVRWSN